MELQQTPLCHQAVSIPGDTTIPKVLRKDCPFGQPFDDPSLKRLHLQDSPHIPETPVICDGQCMQEIKGVRERLKAWAAVKISANRLIASLAIYDNAPGEPDRIIDSALEKTLDEISGPNLSR